MRKVAFLALLLLLGAVSLELLDDNVVPGADKTGVHKMDGPGDQPPSPAP
jgi:hypothetical protein